MERRRDDRRDVRLTCYVGSPEMGVSRLTGISENISRSGMLLVVADCATLPQSIEVGNAATVEVPLPVEHDLGPRSMHCEAKVVRIASSDEQVHIALRFKSRGFRALERGSGPLTPASTPGYLM